MYKLVLIRHGESTWNLENRFTGWTDVDLTPTGVSQAISAGQLLKAEGFEFDLAYTSVLKRAIHTLRYALDEMDSTWLPVVKELAPERAPLRRPARPEQGRNGPAIRRRAGAGVAPQLRHPAPALEATDAAQRARRPPLCQSWTRAADSADRVPQRHRGARGAVLERDPGPRASRSGERVVIAAHGNSIRALVKYLDNIGDDAIVGVNIPNGIPLVYELDDDLQAHPPATTWAMPKPPPKQLRPWRAQGKA